MNKLLTLAILTVFIGCRVIKGSYFNNKMGPYRIYIRETREDIETKIKKFQNENFAAIISIENFLGFTKGLTEHKLQQNLTEALNNTRGAVETAMAQGKNSEHCLVEASPSFEQLKKDVSNRLIACASKIEKQFASQRGFVNIVLKKAKVVLDQLNMITSTCLTHFGLVVSCVEVAVERVKPQVKNFNDNYKLALALHEIMMEGVRRNASLCYEEQEHYQREQIEILTKSTQSCIDAM